MISAIATEPLAIGASAADSRPRFAATQRPILPDSTTAAPRSPEAGNETLPQQQDEATSEQASRKPSTIFAAAVLSGALAPTPESLTELFIRIGASAIPPESQARLKDLTV